MPVLVAGTMALPESDTICRYLLDRFQDSWPSFVPTTPEARAKSNLLSRLHDMSLSFSPLCLASFYQSVSLSQSAVYQSVSLYQSAVSQSVSLYQSLPFFPRRIRSGEVAATL